MPDISMCANINCSRRSRCYRYLAIPSKHWQSYAEFTAENCEYFWDVKGYARTSLISLIEVDKRIKTRHYHE